LEQTVGQDAKFLYRSYSQIVYFDLRTHFTTSSKQADVSLQSQNCSIWYTSNMAAVTI